MLASSFPVLPFTNNAGILRFNNVYALSNVTIEHDIKDQTVEEGKTARFPIKANGTNLTYKWEWSKDNGKTWSVSSNKSATYAVNGSKTFNGYMYRCIVSDGTTEVVSNTARLIVAGTLTINQNITDQKVPDGQIASFPIKATGANLTYKWEWSKDNGKTWGICSNKTATYTIRGTKALNGYIYRCTVSDGTNTVVSNAAKLIVTDLKIDQNITDQKVSDGQIASFPIKATGANLTYKWEWSKDNGKTWGISSNKTATYTVRGTKALNGYVYRCTVSDGTNTVVSNVAKLIVTDLKIDQNITDQKVLDGQIASFPIKATGANLTYKWEWSKDNGKTWGISSNKTATYIVRGTKALNGYVYRCTVSDGTNTVVSNAAKLIVENPLKIDQNITDKTVNEGQTASFPIKVSGENLTYKWEWSKDNGKTWGVSSNKSAIYAVKGTMAVNGYMYRCVITDSNGSTITSNTVTLTVKTPLTISEQPISTTILENNDVMFSLKASSSDPITYQWQVADPSTTSLNWENIEGATAPSYIFKAAFADNGKIYRCIVSDMDESISSSTATLTVEEAYAVIKNETKEITIAKGQEYQLDFIGKGLRYYSDSKIATVDQNGLVTAQEEGTANIFIIDVFGHNAFYKIHITEPYEALAFDESEYSVIPDHDIQLNINKYAYLLVSNDKKIHNDSYYNPYYVFSFVGKIPGKYDVIAYTDDGEITSATVNVEGKVIDAVFGTKYTSEIALDQATGYDTNVWYRYYNDTDECQLLTFDTFIDTQYCIYMSPEYDEHWIDAQTINTEQLYLIPGEEVYVRPYNIDSSPYEFKVNSIHGSTIDYTIGTQINDVVLNRDDFTDYVFTADVSGEYELGVNSRTPFYWEVKDLANNNQVIACGYVDNGGTMQSLNLKGSNQYAIRFQPQDRSNSGTLKFMIDKVSDVIINATVNTEYEEFIKGGSIVYYKYDITGDMYDVLEFSFNNDNDLSYEILSDDMYTPYETYESLNGKKLYVKKPITIYVKVTGDNDGVAYFNMHQYAKNITPINEPSDGYGIIENNSTEWFEFTAPEDGSYDFDFSSYYKVNFEVYFGEEMEYDVSKSSYCNGNDGSGTNFNSVLKKGEKVYIKVTGDFYDNSTKYQFDWSVTFNEA